MFYIIKGLYIKFKIRSYNKAIVAMTKARQKIKVKQAKFTERYEYYVKQESEL